MQKIDSNPAYKNIFARIPGGRNITLLHLADTTMPSDEDVKNIIAYHNDLSHCRARGIEDYMQIAPSVIPIVVPSYYASDLVTVELIQKKITYGEANKKKQAIYLELMSKLQVEIDRLNREFSASYQAQMAQQAAAFNVLSQWLYQQQILRQNQQLINAINRPVITDCSRFGNSINCTSY